MSKTLEEKLKKIADKLCTPKNEILYNVTLEEVNLYLQESAKQGYELCQKEYEEKLRWLQVEELPKQECLILLELSGCGGSKKYVIYDFDPEYFQGNFNVNGVVKRWRKLIL